MNKFEATVLFNPDLSTQALDKEVKSFESNINKIEGKIINSEEWGIRDLSYNISNYKKAFYNFYQIEAEGKNISNIHKNLNQNEKILRYLFVKVDEHLELPTKIKNEEK